MDKTIQFNGDLLTCLSGKKLSTLLFNKMLSVSGGLNVDFRIPYILVDKDCDPNYPILAQVELLGEVKQVDELLTRLHNKNLIKM